MSCPAFDGNPDFKFRCPNTRQDASVVTDPGTALKTKTKTALHCLSFSSYPGITMKMFRVANSLGIGAVPTIFFRYGSSAQDEPDHWVIFSPVDQLKLMAKFTFVYMNRTYNSAVTFLLGDHLVIMECVAEESVQIHDDGRETKWFRSVLILNLNVGPGPFDRESRRMELVVAKDETNPFSACSGIIGL